MADDPSRTRETRAAAERALVRIVHHYGTTPEFVVLGGLMPDLLCSTSPYRHAGTTDIDVQVNLEIACGAVNMRRLEQALLNAEFEPDSEQVWRWIADGPTPRTVVKFELLADLDDQPAQVTLRFEGCDRLGAVNLRGTGVAARDFGRRELRVRSGGVEQRAYINVIGLAGYLLAKIAAARSRRKAKDWYDIAFVLLHNDAGGPGAAADAVRLAFASELVGATRTALDELAANFTSPSDQGPQAYVEQMMLDHDALDHRTLAVDAITAVRVFHQLVVDQL
jgi:hypothetical protein